MATTPAPSAFEVALDKFKKELRPKHRTAFQKTTLDDLLVEIDKIQKDQHSTRRLQAIGRLKPTLEALNQLGKVVETFVNTSEIVAFVWVRPANESSSSLVTCSPTKPAGTYQAVDTGMPTE